MSRPSLGTDRTPVAIAARPSSKGWTAGCLAVGSICLGLALGAALSEKAGAAPAALAAKVLSTRLASGD